MEHSTYNKIQWRLVELEEPYFLTVEKVDYDSIDLVLEINCENKTMDSNPSFYFKSLDEISKFQMDDSDLTNSLDDSTEGKSYDMLKENLECGDKYRVHLEYSDSSPLHYYIGVGSGTTGIEIIDGTYEYIDTSEYHIQIGDSRGNGGIGHVALTEFYFKGNESADFGVEYGYTHYNSGWVTSFKEDETGSCSYEEKGKVRTVLKCVENGDKNDFYFLNNMRMFYLESYQNDDDWGMTLSDMTVDGSGNDPYLYHGNGSPGGYALFTDGATATRTATEGWRGYNEGNSWIGGIWNIENTTGIFYTVDNGAATQVYIGYNSIGGSMNIPQSEWFKEFVFIANNEVNLTSDDIRMLWNSSFYEDNTTITSNTGSSFKTNALIARLATVSNEGDWTIDPIWSEVYPKYNNLITVEIGNFSSAGDIYVYNHSGTSELSSGDLWHHYTYDTDAHTWKYGSYDNDSGDLISQHSNETQFCNATNYCNDIMSSSGNEEFYLVTQFDYSDDFRIYASDTPLSGECDGHLVVELVEPEENVEVVRHQNFTLEAKVTCVGGCCGDVNATADPKTHVSEVSNKEGFAIMEALREILVKFYVYVSG